LISFDFQNSGLNSESEMIKKVIPLPEQKSFNIRDDQGYANVKMMPM